MKFSKRNYVKLTDPFTTTDLVCHRYRISLPDWHGPSFRIAHLTDLHVHPNLPTEYYHQVLCAVEQAEPDLAFFIGDFITNLNSVPKLREVLRPVGKLGTFAVLGNHDSWVDISGQSGERVANNGLEATRQSPRAQRRRSVG